MKLGASANDYCSRIQLPNDGTSIVKTKRFFDTKEKNILLRLVDVPKNGGYMTNEVAINGRDLLDSEAVSTRVKPRKRGVAAYAKNPFWKPTEVKVGKRKVTIAGGFISQNETGETVHHAGIHRIEEVDETQFIKLFTKNIKVFFDLSLASQKVLQCVLAVLQKNPNAEGIHLPWFEVEDYSKENDLKISRSTFHRALREMLEKGFIAESENANFYWINPNLFFNGDRMTFITEYRKQSTATAKEAIKQSVKKITEGDQATRDALEAAGQQRIIE